MSLYSKVAWKDGMFLLPQHFQQAERSLELTLALRLAETSRLSWGVLTLRLDPEALAARTVKILTCRAIFPDGLTTDIPDGDREPEQVHFELPADGALDVYLTVPARRSGVPLVAVQASEAPTTRERGDSRGPQRASIRYLEDTVEVPDDQEPQNRQTIEVAHKNLRIKLGGDSLDGLHSIKIAELRRGPAGTPILHEGYVPPVPYLAAAPALARRGRDLLGAIAARASELNAARQQRGGGETLEISPAEVPDFWFLSLLNQHLPVLRHLLELPSTHTADLYAELLRLAGSLCTFLLQPPLELPSYQHEAIGPCFAALDQRIRQLLTWKNKQRWLSFPVKAEGRFWTSLLSEPALLADGEFFLQASGLPGAELDKLPPSTIMGELGKIDDFAERAYKGVRLEPVPRPPPPVPVRGDARYFRVQIESPHWGEIRKSGRAALFLPKSFSSIHMELIGVIGGGR